MTHKPSPVHLTRAGFTNKVVLRHTYRLVMSGCISTYMVELPYETVQPTKSKSICYPDLYRENCHSSSYPLSCSTPEASQGFTELRVHLCSGLSGRTESLFSLGFFLFVCLVWFGFSRQGFSMWSRLSWNSLCKPSWPQTHRSASL